MSKSTCELILLATSDLHGFILPRSYADQREVGYGLARVSSIIKQLRQDHPYTLLIDNGDCLQGTPLTYYHAKVNSKRPNPVIACMNKLRYDAAVLGNHEFNYGLPYLQQAVDASAFPWLSANTLDETTGQPLFREPYIIKQLDNGLRVGILGLTTSYVPHWELPQHIAGIQFEDPIETAKHWVAHLREVEACDIVIVSYHGGFERDIEHGNATEPLTGENIGYALCEQVEGIDVLITGHQHRAIADCFINGVCIVQPADEGRFLGKVTLQLEKSDKRWQLIQCQSELIEAAIYEPDSDIERLVAEDEALTQAWLDLPLGYVDGDMLITSPADARLTEHPFIEFVNKLQMHVSGADISCTALFDNETPGFPSQVTMRHIVTNYIYPNTLRVIQLAGRDIRAALEKTAEYFRLDERGNVVVSEAFLHPKPQHYNYDMWEGIDYTLDISRAIGRRVVQLERHGEPLADDQLYEVVMNNYRAGGGGNYEMLQDKPIVKDISVTMVELIASYIQAQQHIEASVNNNWRVTNGAVT